jgi:phage tail sheath protein FI
MPEYLAPGVYVEETSFRARSIEGVGTSTTAFVGPTRKGPFRIDDDTPEPPELLTSFGDFERIYGGLADLDLGAGAPGVNYLAHAVRAFFNEGGGRLYVGRVLGADPVAASVDVLADPDAPDRVRFVARFPGRCGDGTIDVREAQTPVAERALNSAPVGTLVRTGVDVATTQMHLKVGADWQLVFATPMPDPLPANAGSAALAALTPRIVTLAVLSTDGDGNTQGFEGLALDRRHPAFIGHVLAAAPGRRADQLQNLFAIEVGANVGALGLLDAMMDGATANADGEFTNRFTLAGGDDGAVPGDADYTRALADIGALEDVSIVAAPGSSAYAANAQAIALALISHAESRRAYRIAVLDTPPDLLPGGARDWRAQFDSRYAAMYYPWVVVSNPLARAGREDIPRELPLPPSGYVCGIYARNDVERGVHKAPANEVVRSALRFATEVNFAQQQMLNPLGVNCLRFFSGRGNRVWGARLASSDPEWKYVSDRRYFNYLEASIDRSTQWAVFEPNGERLWSSIRQTVTDFLYNEWRNGALLGSTIEEAFFVQCSRATMTQNDLDNGRLVCLIGVALVRPAEFVIFRIGQKTADARA